MGQVPTPARWLIGIIGVVFAYSLPLLHLPVISDAKASFPSLLGGTVIIYVIVALGLNVVVGLAGLLDLGYVGFYAIGAYTVAVLSSRHASLPWLLCLPIAVAVAMGAGVLLGAPTLRLRGDYLAIVTLGFGEIIRLLAQKFDWLGAASGISNIPFPPNVGPLKFGALHVNAFYYLGLTLVIIIYFFLHRLENSRVGRAWTAIREDEDAAELMGVPTFKYKLWAFAIGAAVGSVAGRAVRDQDAVHQPGQLRPAPVDPVPRRRGARRAGQHARCHPRCRRRVLPARAASFPQHQPLLLVRRAARRADDLPPAGPVATPPGGQGDARRHPTDRSRSTRRSATPASPRTTSPAGTEIPRA